MEIFYMKYKLFISVKKILLNPVNICLLEKLPQTNNQHLNLHLCKNWCSRKQEMPNETSRFKILST